MPYSSFASLSALKQPDTLDIKSTLTIFNSPAANRSWPLQYTDHNVCNRQGDPHLTSRYKIFAHDQAVQQFLGFSLGPTVFGKISFLMEKLSVTLSVIL